MKLHCGTVGIILLAFINIISGARVALDPGIPVIGIDLGTTYSCVAVSIDGRREVIPNSQGNRITPSYVAFTPDGVRLIGDAAKNQLTTNPKNTVFDIKRIIGRRWDDKTLQDEIKEFPFKVVEMGGKPRIQLTTSPGKTGYFSPEEISAMILGRMKETAEAHLGMNITHAVVTVPAYFSDAQRQATKDAAAIAGLELLRIINEPTAAAIAYGLDRKDKKDDSSIVLVYDLGGGTLDVSLLDVTPSGFAVISTSGNTHLGGEDFERRVIQHFVTLYKKNHNLDISKNDRAIQKLRREVERSKRVLSSVTATRLEVENLVDGKDFSETLTRGKFVELNIDLFKETLISVQRVLDDADMKPNEIDEIALVGGSTRIPKIKELVESFFSKEAARGVNPDEAVALGAAIHAGMLAGQGDDDPSVLVDVNPFTLGIETEGGKMSVLIPRNTVIPVKKKDRYSTARDNQDTVSIRVFEGERTLTKDNRFLGQFDLTGIPPAPKSVPKIEVEFFINSDGILVVSATDVGTRNENKVTISTDHGRLTPGEIKKKIKEAQSYSEEDKITEQKFAAKDELQSLIYQAKHKIAMLGSGKLSYEEEAAIEEAGHQAESWLEDHPLEEVSVYKSKIKELENVIHPIVKKLYGTQQTAEEGEDKRNFTREYDEL